jgi:hypothetical protein
MQDLKTGKNMYLTLSCQRQMLAKTTFIRKESKINFLCRFNGGIIKDSNH